ncbi:hypothetical protein I6E12_11975 [Prevotella brevis]|uniref:Uncharacterized protein n=1 Tax=Xylanibacter brevis TaxID=83231 RepID=A0ABS9CKV4_9BACT|nr:hypothetical protein [Xylanibacter brevis]MCF2564814.1 hypothetical protein [Xylanibacter brevis]
MRYGYDMYRYLIFAHKDLTEDYFVEKSGAIGGYAKELFQRIYKSIFSESMDVQYMYDTFFLAEYRDLAEFLKGYYQLEPEWANEIVDILNNRKELRLYEYDSLSAGENFDDFITSDEVYKRFEKLLMMSV